MSFFDFSDVNPFSRMMLTTSTHPPEDTNSAEGEEDSSEYGVDSTLLSLYTDPLFPINMLHASAKTINTTTSSSNIPNAQTKQSTVTHEIEIELENMSYQSQEKTISPSVSEEDKISHGSGQSHSQHSSIVEDDYEGEEVSRPARNSPYSAVSESDGRSRSNLSNPGSEHSSSIQTFARRRNSKDSGSDNDDSNSSIASSLSQGSYYSTSSPSQCTYDENKQKQSDNNGSVSDDHGSYDLIDQNLLECYADDEEEEEYFRHRHRHDGQPVSESEFDESDKSHVDIVSESDTASRGTPMGSATPLSIVRTPKGSDEDSDHGSTVTNTSYSPPSDQPVVTSPPSSNGDEHDYDDSEPLLPTKSASPVLHEKPSVGFASLLRKQGPDLVTSLKNVVKPNSSISAIEPSQSSISLGSKVSGQSTDQNEEDTPGTHQTHQTIKKPAPIQAFLPTNRSTPSTEGSSYASDFRPTDKPRVPHIPTPYPPHSPNPSTVSSITGPSCFNTTATLPSVATPNSSKSSTSVLSNRSTLGSTNTSSKSKVPTTPPPQSPGHTKRRSPLKLNVDIPTIVSGSSVVTPNESSKGSKSIATATTATKPALPPKPIGSISTKPPAHPIPPLPKTPPLRSVGKGRPSPGPTVATTTTTIPPPVVQDNDSTVSQSPPSSQGKIAKTTSVADSSTESMPPPPPHVKPASAKSHISPGLKQMMDRHAQHEKDNIPLENMKKLLAECDAKIREKREQLLEEERYMKELKIKLVESYLEMSQAVAELLLNDHLDLADEISKVHSTYESCMPQIEQLRIDDALEMPSVLDTGDDILPQSMRGIVSTPPKATENCDQDAVEQSFKTL